MAADAVATLARIQEASFVRASAATRRAFPPERAMSGADLVAFLDARRAGVLATVRSDGRPHASPVPFALVGPRIVIPSAADAARVSNLAAEPHASLVVMAEDADPRVVVVEGAARVVEPLAAPLEMREPFRDADGALAPWVGRLVILAPERVLSYAGGSRGDR